MNSLDKIKSLNPNLANGAILAEEYDILVVGRKVSGKDGAADTIKFVEKTNPTAAAKEAGVTIQQYLRASFSRAGAVSASAVVNGEESFRGSKRPQPGNIFKNTQTNLFNFAVKKLKDGEYTEVGDIIVQENGSPVKRPVVRVHATVWGAKVSLTVPKYKLTERNASGARQDLTGPKYDPKSDKYIKNAARTAITLRFFADIDDLEEVESLAVSQYERFVMPYETGETITQEVKGNTTTVKVESEPITPEEDLEDNTGEEETDA